jgi:hypothetical protein
MPQFNNALVQVFIKFFQDIFFPENRHLPCCVGVCPGVILIKLFSSSIMLLLQKS